MPSDVTPGSPEDIVAKCLAATVSQLFGVMLGKITGKVVFSNHTFNRCLMMLLRSLRKQFFPF